MWVATLIWPINLCILAFIFLLFPSGHLTSKNWRWAGWLTVAAALLSTTTFGVLIWPFKAQLLVEFLTNPDLDVLLPGSGLLGTVALMAYWLCGTCMLIAVISLSFRFRNAVGVDRLQLKWFAVTSIPLAVTAIISVITTSFNAFSEPVGKGIAYTLMILPICSLPIAAAFAISKYHLYDINIIINRALVYSSLTLTLAVLYFGMVVSLQALLRGLTGQGSEIAVVATTLLIAALSLPLRRGIQGFIDRRFYRRKYDAAQTLSAFSQTARDEIDLQELTSRLVSVVDTTMQPAHISLWLREPHTKEVSTHQS